tara:strand:+ start:13069 stop:14022 length:954 start_codon:yes stop_codon:yes gene_type:complete
MSIWRIFEQVGELASTVFWGLSEGFGLYTPPPTASSMYQEALTGLNQAREAGATVGEACAEYAKHFNNPVVMLEACENKFKLEEALRLADQTLSQSGDPIIPSDITAEYGKLALVGLGLAMTAGIYLYYRSTQVSEPVTATLEVSDRYKDLATYCDLEGSEVGKTTAFADFTKHFRNIMKKYEGMDGPLSDNDRDALEGTLKSLVKYYFWKNHSTVTDNEMRNGLYRKLSSAFHANSFQSGSPGTLRSDINSDKPNLLHREDVEGLIRILGLEHRDMLSSMISTIKSDYPDSIPDLADALTAHDAYVLETGVKSKLH